VSNGQQQEIFVVSLDLELYWGVRDKRTIGQSTTHWKIAPWNSPSMWRQADFCGHFAKKLTFLDGLRLRRIKNAMTHAAKTGQVFHLWWHPHNFGVNADKNMAFLEKVLFYFVSLQKKYDFKTMRMNELAEFAEQKSRRRHHLQVNYV